MKQPNWYRNNTTRNTRLSAEYMQSLTGSASFPTKEASLLTTTRTEGFVSQTLHSKSGVTYFRTGTNNQWSKWVSLDNHVGSDAGDTNGKPLYLYPNHATQHTKLDSAYMNSLEGVAAFPTKEPGMLTTTRSDSYAKQTLHSRDGKVYFRTGVGDKWYNWSASTPL